MLRRNWMLPRDHVVISRHGSVAAPRSARGISVTGSSGGRFGLGAAGVPGVAGVDQVGVVSRLGNEFGNEGADDGDGPGAGTDFFEHPPHHDRADTFAAVALLDLGVLERIPVRLQMGVVQPPAQLATAMKLESTLFNVVD